MKEKKIISVLLGLLLILTSATVVYAGAQSYYETTVGYGAINLAQSDGPGLWSPLRVEYTTQPYILIDQIGATYWSVYNTCDGNIIQGTVWSSSSNLIDEHVRSTVRGVITRGDGPCDVLNGHVLKRVNYVQHWWQHSYHNGGGDPNPTAFATAPYPSFVDVPRNDWAYTYVEFMYQMGIMDIAAIRNQCPTTGYFCPNNPVTRAQMAYYLERGMRGSNHLFNNPFAGYFYDVPSWYWDSKVIERFYLDGLTVGCLNYPLRYCPDGGITRAEMAIFLLKTLYGSNFTPPNYGSYSFTDTPGHWAADWIERFYAEGITGGCATYPSFQYCPDRLVTQAEMAVFLQRTFLGVQ